MKNNGRGRNAQNSGSKWGPFLFGALAGGAVGAAIALLYAPTEGTEFRKDVGEKFDEISENVNSILRSAKMAAEKMLNEGRGHSEDILGSEYDDSDDMTGQSDDGLLRVRKASSEETNSGNHSMGNTGNASSATDSTANSNMGPGMNSGSISGMGGPDSQL